MKIQGESSSQGIVIFAFCAAALWLAIRAIPAYYSHYHIHRAVESLHGKGNSIVAEQQYRQAFQQWLDDEGYDHLTAQALTVDFSLTGEVTMRLAYADKRRYLGNLFVCVEFDDKITIEEHHESTTASP